VANVDVTIVCESPRIGPHVQAMQQSIGGVLDVPVSAVSIKATTTEGLGLCGRGEGIAATAVALIQGV
jgi:2-C-methyl-D-erythritol 4-phosphate cytidylyltransferase/2-C-methyl-D-erythritol 2,4-cyclodiphosphate synthase